MKQYFDDLNTNELEVFTLKNFQLQKLNEKIIWNVGENII